VNENSEGDGAAADLNLSEEDRRLYREVLDESIDLPAEDARLERLRELGVIFTEPLTKQLGTRSLPHAERTFYQREIAEIARHAERIREIAPILDALARETDGQETGTGNAVEILRAKKDINSIIFDAIERSDYVWSSQTGPRSPEGLQRSITRDMALLGQGVQYRNIYPTSARTRLPETEYARMTSGTGNAEARTSSRRYARMILTESVGVVSDIRVGEGAAEPAIIIRDPALLAWLMEMFGREWETADPWFPDPADGDAVSDRELVERDILVLLSEGNTRNAICRKLEISERTYSNYTAALRERYRARTNEQLMFAWGKRRQP